VAGEDVGGGGGQPTGIGPGPPQPVRGAAARLWLRPLDPRGLRGGGRLRPLPAPHGHAQPGGRRVPQLAQQPESVPAGLLQRSLRIRAEAQEASRSAFR